MLAAFVSLFLPPLNWIIVLFIAAWSVRKRRAKKIFFVAAITVLGVGGLLSWIGT